MEELPWLSPDPASSEWGFPNPSRPLEGSDVSGNTAPTKHLPKKGGGDRVETGGCLRNGEQPSAKDGHRPVPLNT